ncbi:MFS transporter [soil metagenome]|nr:MFS transporter [Euzebyaceae bacterium]
MPLPGQPPDAPRPLRVRLHGWRHPAILSAAFVSMAAGFAQFGATAALGDVAAAFGELGEGTTIADQVALSGTTLGVGLAVIRLASVASLPLAGLADRRGRRSVLIGCCAGGLALTAAAALSPSFWWLVAVFALGRPLLSATNAVAGVVAAEETRSADRAKAIALITAGYGTGAGLTALVRGVGGGQVGFRLLFALALVPLALLPFAGRLLEEPDRYARLRAPAGDASLRPRLGHVAPLLRPRLVLLAALTFAIAFVTGPVNAFLFVYAEGVVGLTPASTALVVLAAAPVGLAGLLTGRWAADRFGRRRTAGLAHVAVAVGGAVTYTSGVTGAVAGYLLGAIFAASAYAPSAGALGTEVFPTSVRATAAGWLTVAGVLGAVAGLLAFGLVADAFGSFGPAAVAVAAPVALAAVGYAGLPETRGLELEESAPES